LAGLSVVIIKVSSYSAGSWLVVIYNNHADNIWGSSWSWTGLSGLINQTTYQIVAKDQDKAGNWSPVYSTTTFVYDTTKPSVGIIAPVNSRYYGVNAAESAYYLSQLNGTSSDAYGINKTEIQLYEVATSSYWHTTGWVVNQSSWQYVGQDAWQFSPVPPLVNGRQYRIEARSYDIAGNLAVYATNYFYYDSTVPAVLLGNPNTAGFLKNLAQITGTASDVGSGMLNAQTAIQQSPPAAAWWNGADFTSTSRVWLDDSGHDWPAQTWYLTGASTPTWVTNTKYRVESRSMDVARNTSTIATQEFVYDTQLPAAITTVPAGGYINALAYIRGTAADSNNLGEIKEVQMRVKHVTGSAYWKWADTNYTYTVPEAESAWFVVSSTVTPSYSLWFSTGTPPGSPNGINFASGFDYEINSRAVDKALNYDNQYSTKTFRFDTGVPISSVTVPSAVYISNRAPYTISGTSFDPGGSGITSVKVKVRRNSDNRWWSAVDADFVAPETENNAVLIDPWSIAITAGLLDDTSYYVQTSARDLALLTEPYPGAAARTFWIDYSSPTSAISYPYDNGYISQAGKITGDSSDGPNGLVGEVYVRTKQVSGVKPGHYWRVSDSSWTVQSAPEVWNAVTSSGTLSANATWWQSATTPWQTGEIYEINAYAKDKANNYQTLYSTTTGIKADFTAPISTITMPAEGQTYGVIALSEINGTVQDASPGVVDYVKVQIGYTPSGQGGAITYSYDGATWPNNNTTWLPVSTITLSGNTWSYTLPTAIWQWNNAWYSIRVYGVDKANNTETTIWQRNFRYSAPYPDTWIESPVNNSYLNSKPQVISGKATKYTFVTTADIKVSVERLGDGYYFYGSSFSAPGSVQSAARVYFNTSNVSILGDLTRYWEWADNISTSAWTDNTSYYFLSRGMGTAGSEQVIDLTGNIVTYDATPPNSGVAAPGSGIYQVLSQISGTASDTAPGLADKAEITIQDLTYSATYWNPVGSGWQNSIAWATTTLTAGNWSLNTGLPNWADGVKYRITSKATDKAANVQTSAA
ncbi:MAG: hypothetical protein AAB359_01820, partial [Elusimicrobiota bacterium]